MTKVSIIEAPNFTSPEYSQGDKRAILPIPINSTFTTEGGRVEAFIYDLGGELLNYNSNAKYSIIENGVGSNRFTADALLVYPEEEVRNLGLDVGSYNVSYNFLNNELQSSLEQPFSLSQISANRKELRLTTAFIEQEDLKEEVSKIYPEIITSSYYPDFYVNLGENNLAIANNIVFDNTNNQYSILVKLYEPLPSYAKERDAIWIATKQRDSISYNVEFDPPKISPTPKRNVLKGPNFSLPINNQIHTSIKPTSLEDLQNLTGITTSSRNQLNSLLEEKGVKINIDYTSFDNFIHFSSAEERINNFYYKVGLIESASNSLNDEPSGGDTYLSASRAVIENRITSIIENFDSFEYWMYYSSGAYSNDVYPQPYPKTTSSKPYTLALTGSTAALTWLQNATTSASLYDSANLDKLTKTIPNYLLEDPNNAPYEKFINMVGQHFDTLFTYAQDITNRYNADNRLDFGISKDIVGEAVKSMGINLYTGNFYTSDLVEALVGTSTPTILPDGQQFSTIEDYVTSSDDAIPVSDVNKEIYKRIYHNLPLLLKQKGSIAGLRTLITCFGLPHDILKAKEFDIRYIATTQSLPDIGTSGSITFPDANSTLPPETSTSVPSNFLSPIIKVQQDFVADNDYDRSLQYVEVGYSPQGFIDETDHSGFDPLNGGSFPDFNDFYFGSDINYYGSTFVGGSSAASQDVEWNFSAYIRYIKFLDTSLFNMIKDFVPVRSSTATGVIIKPTIKERQRQRPAQLSYENTTYNAIADVLYYTWTGESGSYTYKAIGDYDPRIKDGSFRWAGWTGGGWNNSNQVQFSGELDWSGRDLATPVIGLTQSWDETMYTILGYKQQLQQTESIYANATYSISHTAQDEFYNGIFKQTGIGGLDNYLIREAAVGSTSDGAGVIRTDNNRFNPYKTPSTTVFPGLTKNNYESLYEMLIDPGDADTYEVVFLATTTPVIYMQYSEDPASSALPFLGVLQANGSSLNFTGSGWNISINVGTPALVNIGGTDFAAFGVLDGLEGIGSGFADYSVWEAASSVAYIAPYSPQGLEIQPGPWAYNEYNPLINNSFDPQAGLVNYNGIRKSEYFMDADYSPSAPNSITPINTIALASGSASRAPVQDSYYTSRWWSNSRYLGVRNSSPDFNQQIYRAVTNAAGIIESGLQTTVSASVPTVNPD